MISTFLNNAYIVDKNRFNSLPLRYNKYLIAITPP